MSPLLVLQWGQVTCAAPLPLNSTPVDLEKMPGRLSETVSDCELRLRRSLQLSAEQEAQSSTR